MMVPHISLDAPANICIIDVNRHNITATDKMPLTNIPEDHPVQISGQIKSFTKGLIKQIIFRFKLNEEVNI